MTELRGSLLKSTASSNILYTVVSDTESLLATSVAVILIFLNSLRIRRGRI